MTTTIDSLISDAITTSLSSDAIAEKIQKAADEAVSKVIAEVFSRYGNFSKALEKQVKEALPIIQASELTNFTYAVQEVCKRQLETLADKTAQQYVESAMKELLAGDPVITMKEFKEEYVTWLKEKFSQEDHCSCHDIDESELEYTWHVEIDTKYSSPYYHLHFGPESDLSRYDSKASRMDFSKHDGLLECYNVSTDDFGIKSDHLKTMPMFAGPIHGFESMLFRLATKVAKLKVD